MRVSEQTREQVMAVLRRLLEAAGRKDAGGILALTDADFRGFWSVPGEKVIGKEALRRHLERGFTQVDTITLGFSSVHIGAEGTVAWVMADLTCNLVRGGAGQTMDGLVTAVLRGTGHAWIFAQIHCTFPAIRGR